MQNRWAHTDSICVSKQGISGVASSLIRQVLLDTRLITCPKHCSVLSPIFRLRSLQSSLYWYHSIFYLLEFYLGSTWASSFPPPPAFSCESAWRATSRIHRSRFGHFSFTFLSDSSTPLEFYDFPVREPRYLSVSAPNSLTLLPPSFPPPKTACIPFLSCWSRVLHPQLLASDFPVFPPLLHPCSHPLTRYHPRRWSSCSLGC